MDLSKLLVAITLLLMSKFRIALSDMCYQLTVASGTISNEKEARSYSNCWKINVPSNNYVHLSMDWFIATRGSCSNSRLEVSIANRNNSTFCPGESTWKPVLAFDDVTITHYINSNSYITSRFSMQYRVENFLCTQKNIFRCYDGACIPQSQMCDGIKHCDGGEDEKACETGVFAVPGVDDSRLNGTRWLMEKWSPTSGWQENTHRGVIALHLATERNVTNIDLKRKLMVKQLEVQALASILRCPSSSCHGSHAYEPISRMNTIPLLSILIMKKL